MAEQAQRRAPMALAQEKSTDNNHAYEELRHLIVAPETEGLAAVEERLDNLEKRTCDVSEVVALDERQAMALRGPRADPSAHILLRPYLRRAVYVGLAEPASDVPYWLVATRHPEELAAAIESARPHDGRPHDGHQSGDWESVG